MRIFQFLGTEDHLTEEFYYEKLDVGLSRMGLTWSEFKDSLVSDHPLIQFKYALPVMMVLASGSFKRKGLNPEEEVNPRIFKFWQECSNLLRKELKKDKPSHGLGHVPWSIVFKLPRGWFFKRRYIKFVRSEKLLKQIRKASASFHPQLKSHVFNITLIKEEWA